MNQTTEVTETQRLFDFLAERCEEFGRQFTYEELSEVIGRDIRVCRGPLYVAIRRLEREKKRSLICVMNVGYRVPHANETPDTVGKRMKRADRQILRGRNTAINTDRNALTLEEKQRLDGVERIANTALHEVRQNRRRIARCERLLEAQVLEVGKVKKKQASTADEIATLREMMEQMKRRLDEKAA